jgi:hypothetical protein
MKPYLHLLYILLGFAVLGIGLYIYKDIRRHPFGQSTTVIRDTTYLPPITVNVPPSSTPHIIIHPVPSSVDTSEILRAYFAQVNYNDSIHTDSVSIWISESVSRNMIQSRDVRWKLNIPVQTITEYRQELKRGLVFGGGGAFHGDQVNVFLSGGVQGKRGSVVFGSIATDGTVQVGWMGRVSR